MKFTLKSITAAALLAVSAGAYAGPFILAGTDADDHGSANATTNFDGWLFMQRALENLAPGVTNGNKVVTILGSTSSSLTAASSAFNKSSLVGAGWTLEVISVANFSTFFGAGGGLSNSGILMMDSGGNVGGGVAGSSFNSYATAINNFVGAGGGLFSQANGYSWLSALIPTLQAVSQSDTGIALTAAGNAAFPGLTNADLSAGPYHNRFDNVGPLPILGVDSGGFAAGTAIILGGAGGSITNPTPPTGVPEPASLLLAGAALAGLAASRRRKQA